eukprot:825550_1
MEAHHRIANMVRSQYLNQRGQSRIEHSMTKMYVISPPKYSNGCKNIAADNDNTHKEWINFCETFTFDKHLYLMHILSIKFKSDLDFCLMP